METEDSIESSDIEVDAASITQGNSVESVASPIARRGLPISHFDGIYYTTPIPERRGNRPAIQHVPRVKSAAPGKEKSNETTKNSRYVSN